MNIKNESVIWSLKYKYLFIIHIIIQRRGKKNRYIFSPITHDNSQLEHFQNISLLTTISVFHIHSHLLNLIETVSYIVLLYYVTYFWTRSNHTRTVFLLAQSTIVPRCRTRPTIEKRSIYIFFFYLTKSCLIDFQVLIRQKRVTREHMTHGW